MIIFPAIDIKDGRCVRLTQGKFDQVSIYNDNPAEVARLWESMGAQYIHLVISMEQRTAHQPAGTW